MVYEIYNFGRPFLGHHYFKLNLSEPWRRNIAFSLYGHTLVQERCHRGHEIYNFGRHFLGHHYCIPVLTLSDLCLGAEKMIFKEIMHFHYNMT